MTFTLENMNGVAVVVQKRKPRPRSRIPRTCRIARRVSWWSRRVDYLGFAK